MMAVYLVDQVTVILFVRLCGKTHLHTHKRTEAQWQVGESILAVSSLLPGPSPGILLPIKISSLQSQRIAQWQRAEEPKLRTQTKGHPAHAPPSRASAPLTQCETPHEESLGPDLHLTFWTKGIAACGCGKLYGNQRKRMLGLPSIYEGMSRRGAKVEKRERFRWFGEKQVWEIVGWVESLFACKQGLVIIVSNPALGLITAVCSVSL